MIQQKNDKNSRACDILKVFLLIISILLVTIIGIAYICPFATEVLAERTIFLQNELTEREISTLTSLIKANKIYTVDFIIERIVSFYELLIAYLLGLLAITGFLGYLYIKKSNKADIQDEVYTIVHSRTFSDLTNIEVKKIFSDEKKEGGELYKIGGDIENLISRLEFLEDYINKQDIIIKVANSDKKALSKKKKG